MGTMMPDSRLRLTREALQLFEQRLRDLHAALVRRGNRVMAALTGKPHAFVFEHASDHHFEALEVRGAARQRFGIDREYRVADSRLVARLEVRVVLEAECGAGERAAQHFDD